MVSGHMMLNVFSHGISHSFLNSAHHIENDTSIVYEGKICIPWLVGNTHYFASDRWLPGVCWLGSNFVQLMLQQPISQQLQPTSSNHLPGVQGAHILTSEPVVACWLLTNF